MKDDFNALDFLSIGGFRMSAPSVDLPGKDKKKKKDKKAKKKKLKQLQMAAALAFPKMAPKRRLSAFLPMLGRKPANIAVAALQGWPMPLSWPGKNVARSESDSLLS